MSWAKNQIGKSYCIDTTKSPYSNNKNWYCSELVWAAFYWQGIYLDSDDNDLSGVSIVWPSEINEYAYANLIMHYQYDTTFSPVDDSNHTIVCHGDTTIDLHNYSAINNCYQKCLICNHLQQTAAHILTYRFEQLDSTSHYAYCECGTYAMIAHNFSVSSTRKRCVDCGYTELINHTHAYTYKSCNDGMHHYKECICGISITESCVGYAQVGGDSVCARCGQTLGGEGLMLLENEGIIVAVPINSFVGVEQCEIEPQEEPKRYVGY